MFSSLESSLRFDYGFKSSYYQLFYEITFSK